MSEDTKLVSKVLVLEGREQLNGRIKTFCDENNLVGVKAHGDNVMSILRSNVDLGGIFLSEDYGGREGGGLAIGREIHALRPELPIFLRREASDSLEDLQAGGDHAFRAAYTVADMGKLKRVLDECIFSLVYPNALVRGIAEMTQATLASQFKDVEIACESPYIVRDRIIYGELFSLIPLESNWCRGYMMLQTEEQPLMGFVRGDKTHVSAERASFREINNVLGEITNMIWGAFKNRYVAYEATSAGHLTQVPIIVNHLHRYISFGSEDPQLCFKYTLSDRQGGQASITVWQRFVFNLNWSPDKFKENETSVEALFESGELELF
ncbi:MAG: chemotaxis protein CheX [Aquabacterium sp.]|nr:MAG: chemotaxis protein CheX [Aquabacterium sp.]